MICKDCEQETDTLTKDGICKICARRKNQYKYLKRIYIPLKDVKGTPGYESAMARRKKIKEQKNQKENITTTIIKSAIRPNNLKEKYYAEVMEDVKKSFMQNNLSTEYLNFNVQNFVEIFYSLLQEDNYMSDVRKAEEIFNDTSTDFLHAIENSDWNSKNITDALYREKALLELRRPTKRILCYYRMIEPIIEYLKKDKNILKMVEDLRIALLNNKEKIESTDYIPKQSNLLGADNSVYKKYNCSVPCYNLYGNPELEEFKMKNGTWAKNEVEARRNFLRFIENNFPNIQFKNSDIKIEEE